MKKMFLGQVILDKEPGMIITLGTFPSKKIAEKVCNERFLENTNCYELVIEEIICYENEEEADDVVHPKKKYISGLANTKKYGVVGSLLFTQTANSRDELFLDGEEVLNVRWLQLYKIEEGLYQFVSTYHGENRVDIEQKISDRIERYLEGSIINE